MKRDKGFLLVLLLVISSLRNLGTWVKCSVLSPGAAPSDSTITVPVGLGYVESKYPPAVPHIPNVDVKDRRVISADACQPREEGGGAKSVSVDLSDPFQNEHFGGKVGKWKVGDGGRRPTSDDGTGYRVTRHELQQALDVD